MDKAALLFLKKRGMGLGDAKLLAMLGAFLGWKSVLLIIVLASFLGSFFGIALILWQRRQSARTEESVVPEGAPAVEAEPKLPAEGHYLPFGPYLAVAGLIVMFGGSYLFNLIHDYYFVAPAAPLQ